MQEIEKVAASAQSAAPSARVPIEGQTSPVIPFLVKECVPGSAFLNHGAALHTAYINRLEEALSLPWVQRLPGEKRIRFLHGQIFVMQHYLGCRVVRAHIYHRELSLDKNDMRVPRH